ncbi:hypothetical protein [Chitiniphilus eburneus]|uniref:Winged helix-turn-helix transcriptional regulator n=1 Tax=Chitiniphilus eburneus TaxID=2571148 RepID=A0A4U0Q3N5_9NEIS|nr:hypothetical protein [Chitiniphilus eburneus]TJZ75599.1 hypothetical protein FAZ21_06710 [Chitiniphilus eburneus]
MTQLQHSMSQIMRRSFMPQRPPNRFEIAREKRVIELIDLIAKQLKQGPSTTRELARKVGASRHHIGMAIEHLMADGVVEESSVHADNGRVYPGFALRAEQ